MAKLQTAVLVSMFCLLRKSSCVSGSSELERNSGGSNGGVRHFREKRAATCRDYRSYQTCSLYLSYKQCNYHVARRFCPKTCGFCRSCENTITKDQCDNWVISGFCTNRYPKWMKFNCELSCGHCVCKNNHNSCAYWARNGECKKNPKYMLINCQKSCAVCGQKSTTKPVTKPTRKPRTLLATTILTTVTASRTCGHSQTVGSRTARIVGGIFAKPGEWPWHVGICSNCTEIPFCGGTLINNDWVVTATHCLLGKHASQIFVVLGETNILQKSGHEVMRGVKAIYRHSGYGIDAKYDYDVALLKLNDSVRFTRYIQPACLPHLNPKLPAGMNCTVTGFGRTMEGGDKSQRLKQAKVPLVSHSQCKKVVGDTGPVRITSTMLCAGYAKGGIDACHGDSGGPLVCKSSDGSFELAGVVSWGRGCARPNEYGVYADIQVLRGWIEQKMAMQTFG